MEAPQQLDGGLSTSHTPQSSPERGRAVDGARSLMADSRTNHLPHLDGVFTRKTPESSPDRDSGGVRLSPFKNAGRQTTTTPKASLNHSRERDWEDNSPSFAWAVGPFSCDGAGSSPGLDLEHGLLTGSARHPPKRLPHHFFLDTNSSVVSPLSSPQHSMKLGHSPPSPISLPFRLKTPSMGSHSDRSPHPQDITPTLDGSYSPTHRSADQALNHNATSFGGITNASTPQQNPEHVLERSTISVDGASSTIPPTGQENQSASAVQVSEEHGTYISPGPPAYQPRPLTTRPRRQTRGRLQSMIPSRLTKKHVLYGLRLISLDLLFIVIFSALTGALLLWAPIWRRNERLFPMTYDPGTGTWYGPIEFSYPHHNLILGVTITAVMIPLIPFAVIVLLQFWVRSLLDFHAAAFALKKAIVMMLFLQVILKLYIGEFRPFFISLCNPDPADLEVLRQSLAPMSRTVFANPSHCRGILSHGSTITRGTKNYKDINFAMSSFPSGHTAESFMAGTFLALYLNAKLKPFADFHTSFWKMLVVMAPVIGAMFIAGSLVADRNHHHHDILLSIPLGVLVAFLAYRSHYASILDYRTNHIPLPWSGSGQSLNPSVPNSDSAQQPSRRHQLLKPRNKNFAATPWPRKPTSYSYGRGGEPQEMGTTTASNALDGPGDVAVHPGERALRRRYGVVRRGRTRLALFPRAENINPRGDGLPDRSGVVEPNGRGGFEMMPLVAPGQTVERTASGRTGVDEWVDADNDGEMV